MSEDVVFDYDPRGQLTEADYAALTDEDYAYDENGNRTDDIANVHGADQDYQTGTNNQLLFDGTYRYAYDAEGNRTARWIDNGDGVLGANDT